MTNEQVNAALKWLKGSWQASDNRSEAANAAAVIEAMAAVGVRQEAEIERLRAIENAAMRVAGTFVKRNSSVDPVAMHKLDFALENQDGLQYPAPSGDAGLGTAGRASSPGQSSLEPSSPQGWQPIETAPKDGTVVLIGLAAVGALKDPTERRVYEGRWDRIQNHFTSVNGVILLDCAIAWMHLPAFEQRT